MKKAVSTETNNIDSSTQTESILVNASRRMSDNETENTTSDSVTFKKVASEIKDITDVLSRQLERLWELIKELKDD